MALTLKDADVEALASELAALTGESKTEAVRKALLERRDRVSPARQRARKRDIGRFLETHVWPLVPDDVRGRAVSKEEIEGYLGFGTSGV